MVKVHKPAPKTIKKSGPGLKKIQTKVVKANSTKEVAKKGKKTLAAVAKNKAKTVQTKVADQKNEKKELLENIKETVSKKKPLVKKSVINGGTKKPPTLKDALKPAKKIVAKKKTAATKIQQTVQNSALEKMPAMLKKCAPKKIPLEEKVQLKAKKPLAKKSSALEVESGKKGKDLPTKKQVTAKVKKFLDAKSQETTKPPSDKKNFALGKKSEAVKKEPTQKKSVVAKKQLLKKPIATKKNNLVEASKKVKIVIPKKKLITSKGQEDEQNRRKKPLASEVEKPERKKLNSRVQKKVSVEKKNRTVLKKKVQKNISEVKKAFQKDKCEVIKSKEEKSPIFEPENFDEDKFKNIVSFKNIEKVVKALKVQVEKEVAAKKKPVFRDYQYFLNISCFKIPNCPKRMVKLNLSHAIIDTDVDDVVLIVPDLQRGAKVDYEPTIQHYNDLLGQYEFENLTVMPFNQLRNECTSFEAKRKLANTYDRFLCDGRIVSHVVGFCGTPFQKPRTTIHAVNLSNSQNCKNEIERALKRTSYRQLKQGDLTSILVGSHRFTSDQLAENITKVIAQLQKLFPGGYANIRNIYIKIDVVGTSSLPLYVSMAGAPDNVPNIIGPREQKMLKLKKEANEILSKFSMTKSGDFVKLNKAEVKRKQEISKTREALSSKENIEGCEDANGFNPPSNKKSKNQVHRKSDEREPSDSDVDVNDEDGEVSDAKSEEIDECDEDGEEVDQDDEVGEDSEEIDEDGEESED